MQIETIPKGVLEFREYLEIQPGQADVIEFETLSVDALVLAIYLAKNYQLKGTRNFKPIFRTEVTLHPNQEHCHHSLLKLIPESSIRLSKNNSPEDLYYFQIQYGELYFHQIKNNPIDSLAYIDSMNVCMRHLKWTCNLEIDRLMRFIIKKKFVPILVNYQTSELLEYWKQLALDECLEYMINRIRQVSKEDFVPHFELISRVKELLDSFSVSQIFNMIWSNSNFCLGIVNDKGGTMQGLFPKSFINYSKIAVEKGFTINGYDKRHHSLCRSELHQTFFEDLLNDKRDPFSFVISEQNLKMIYE